MGCRNGSCSIDRSYSNTVKKPIVRNIRPDRIEIPISPSFIKSEQQALSIIDEAAQLKNHEWDPIRVSSARKITVQHYSFRLMKMANIVGGVENWMRICDAYMDGAVPDSTIKKLDAIDWGAVASIDREISTHLAIIYFTNNYQI